MNPEDFGITNYKMNNGKIDVTGNVDLSEKGLTEIPFNFGEVTEIFDVHSNYLTSFKNCPHTVSKDFNASYNEIINLENFPKMIFGEINLTSNKISDINGICEFNHKTYHSSLLSLASNPLDSLKGLPKIYKNNFYLILIDCGLKSLKGINTATKMYIDVSKNKLTNLTDLKGVQLLQLRCGFNQIETLNNGPQKIYKVFKAGNNQIQSLDGLPELEGYLDLRNNLLTEIKFSGYWKNKVNLDYDCLFNFSNNPLINIDELKNIQKHVEYYDDLCEEVENRKKMIYIKENLK